SPVCPLDDGRRRAAPLRGKPDYGQRNLEFSLDGRRCPFHARAPRPRGSGAPTTASSPCAPSSRAGSGDGCKEKAGSTPSSSIRQNSGAWPIGEEGGALAKTQVNRAFSQIFTRQARLRKHLPRSHADAARENASSRVPLRVPDPAGGQGRAPAL